MPGTVTTSLLVIAMAALAVAMIGERRLQRVDWSRLVGLRVRWSQPETRLLMVTLAAAIGAFAAMGGAFASYGFELHAIARSDPETDQAADKLAVVRAYATSGAVVFGYAGWRMWRGLRQVVRVERIS